MRKAKSERIAINLFTLYLIVALVNNVYFTYYGANDDSLPLQKSIEKKRSPSHNVPLVIICALRPSYLQQTLQSLEVQIPSTPDWIGRKRYLFVHRHSKNDVDGNYDQVKELAERHNLTIHLFDGLHDKDGPMNINANYAWYKMMHFLFHELHEQEALILEEDAPLAPDALFVAAVLLQAKWRRNDIHSICLGAWSGSNRINANPYSYLAVRSHFFQAMAYSMNHSLFDHILEDKKNQLLFGRKMVPDWTEEIVLSQFLANMTQLTPSVGRMQHIGAKGMGLSGNGQNRSVTAVPPWKAWEEKIQLKNKSMADFYLEPNAVTDRFGFICRPLRHDCGLASRYKFGLGAIWGKTNVPRTQPTLRPSDDLLGDLVPIVGVSISSNEDGGSSPEHLYDGDFFTRWASVREGLPQWIAFDLGKPVLLRSLEMYWEAAFATQFQIQVGKSMDPSSAEWKTIFKEGNGKGFNEYINIEGHTAQYLRILCERKSLRDWGVSLWEIEVRTANRTRSSGAIT